MSISISFLRCRKQWQKRLLAFALGAAVLGGSGPAPAAEPPRPASSAPAASEPSPPAASAPEDSPAKQGEAEPEAPPPRVDVPPRSAMETASDSPDVEPSLEPGALGSSPEEASPAASASNHPGPSTPSPAPAAVPHRFTFSYGGGKPVVWPSRYRRFGIADGILTAAGAAAAITSGIIGPNRTGPSGGIWFDDAVRDALRPDAYQSRLLAADLSDVLIGFSITYGLMLDPLVNAGWLRKSKDVGRQLFALNAEVLAVTLGIQQVFANGIGRERPYGQVCGTAELDGRTFDCTGDDRFRSHFSGHSAISFSMAAATCTHHSFLPLSGKPPIGICALGFSNAIATALMRIVADKHYLSDTMVGSAVGALIGWGLPFLHYKTGLKSGFALTGGVEVLVLPYPGGASVMGVMP